MKFLLAMDDLNIPSCVHDFGCKMSKVRFAGLESMWEWIALPECLSIPCDDRCNPLTFTERDVTRT